MSRHGPPSLPADLAGCALVAPLATTAQRAVKVHRIGFSGAGTRTGWGPEIEARMDRTADW